MTRITVRNNIFQHIQVLKTNRTKRNRYGEFVVEGVRNINEAVKNGWQIKSFLYGEAKLSDWAQELLATVKTKENFSGLWLGHDIVDLRKEITQLIEIERKGKEELLNKLKEFQLWKENMK